MKTEQTKQEIAQVIEREQIISYKKKPNKTHKESKEDEEDIDSAQSLKSGVFLDDSVRFNKRNNPLPQLYRDKKKMFSKNVTSEQKHTNNYLEKEVRQHDNLVLKQKNNYLTSENMKLKTKIMNMEKQVIRLTKQMEEDENKMKIKPGIIFKDSKFKGSQSLSLKMTIKNLRKELDQQKKENQKIKWSIKFTTISELEFEREAILEETVRLRRLLEEEQMKRAYLKVRQQGASGMEQKIHSLNEKCYQFMKQNGELKNELKKVQEMKKSKQASENEKHLSKMLLNARKLVKEKEKELEEFKMKSEKSLEKPASLNGITSKSSKEIEKRQIFNTKKRIKDSDKRVMSKSAQKYRKTIQSNPNCENCEKLQAEILALKNRIEQLNIHLKEEREKNTDKKFADFNRNEIFPPTTDQADTLNRFLKYRFQAHHLNLNEADKYLTNSEEVNPEKDEEISLKQMSEYLIAEPFSIITSRYLEVFLFKLFYPELKQKSKKKLEEQKKLKKSTLIKNFRNFISEPRVLEQAKEEEMFIQVAQLITNYHQHILAALDRKRNGEGTIVEEELISFFNEIELQKQFIDFIITQIILQSLDLEHLNYYSMFQIFYMPQSIPEQTQNLKKKFEVDHNQIVKEEDEEYEESRSYAETKQKTQSHKDEQELEEEYSVKENARNLKIIDEQKQKYEQDKQKKNIHENEEYEQLFEEEKIEPEDKDGEIVEDEIKPYKMSAINEEYEDDFQAHS